MQTEIKDIEVGPDALYLYNQTVPHKYHEPLPIPTSGKDKPRVIVIAGSPGSGKGEQSRKLLQNDSYVYLPAGDIFRDAVQNQTDLGKQAEPYLRNNDFVPDDLVINIFFGKIKELTSGNDKTVILDGFPRNGVQAYYLHCFANVAYFILIDVPSNICFSRIMNRRVDPITNITYTQERVSDPEIENRLTKRKSDQDPDNIQLRLKTYSELLGDILFYFENILHVVDGENSPEEVNLNIERKLESIHPPQSVFCGSCQSDIATNICIPCGHKSFCELCSVESKCDQCSEPIKRYIVINRQGWKNLNRDFLIGEVLEEDYDKYKLSVDLCSAPKQSNRLDLNVSVKTNDITRRIPSTICCVIDISGSMSSPAIYEDTNGNMLNEKGNSVLDVVKRAVITIINSLKPQDKLAIITYSDDANIICSLDNVTSANKTIMNQKVSNIKVEGGTNIWAGLNMALSLLQGNKSNASIFLMTDGRRQGYTFEPEELKKYKGNLLCQVHTFGIGSNLDRDLMLKLAEYGNGTYSFIPDSGVAESAINRALANVGTVSTQNAKLKITLLNGCTFDGNINGYLGSVINESSNIRVVDLSSLHFGQKRDVVISIKGSDFKMPYLKAELFCDGESVCEIESKNDKISLESRVAFARNEMVYQLTRALAEEKVSERNIIVKSLINKMTGWKFLHPIIESYLEDLEGRIQKGLDKDRFATWGHHYVSSFKRSHQLQLSTNYMDISLRNYSGTLFQAYLFLCSQVKSERYLPEPEQALTIHATVPQYTPAPQYYGGGGGGGGCIFWNCTVICNNKKTFIKDVRPGDKVKTIEGYATVKYLCEISEPVQLYVLKNRLIITPTHPIRIEGKCVKPKDQPWIGGFKSDKVYNLVLDNFHVFLIEDVECVTWGHDFTNELKHPFYGSSLKIETELKKLPCEDGVTRIKCFIRDKDDHIVGFE